jgi:uncharacterized membrane protein
MSTVDDIYIRLAEIHAYAGESEKFRNDLNKLVETGKTKEEAILTLAMEKGLTFYECIRKVEGLVKKGKTNKQAVSEVAKTMKINPEAEEKVREIQGEALGKRLFGTEEEPSESPIPPPTSPIPRMSFRVLMKYFVHGIAFSFLFLVLAFVLVFVLVFLVAVGSFIGLIIGFGILMLTIGGLNCFLTGVIWGEETNTSFWSVLLHGVVLFVILLFVNGILVMVPNLVFPSIATTVVTFIIGAFAGGFVGKKVAGLFEEGY